jgi:lysophospholipase L1-like esterase
MRISPHAHLIMIGDSITASSAQGTPNKRTREIGVGYVSMVDALLMTNYPDYAIRVSNLGVDGNTVRDLKERWQCDVVENAPDWLSIMIGTNDVWRQFDLPRCPEKAIMPQEFSDLLENLIVDVRAQLSGLVLFSPYYIELNVKDEMRSKIVEYQAVVKHLSAKYDALFIDTQKVFDSLLKHMHSSSIAWDRVHPNHFGHMSIAQSFLNGINFDWKRTPK